MKKAQSTAIHYYKKPFWRRFLNDYQLTLMLIPGIIFYFVSKFCYYISKLIVFAYYIWFYP